MTLELKNSLPSVEAKKRRGRPKSTLPDSLTTTITLDPKIAQDLKQLEKQMYEDTGLQVARIDLIRMAIVQLVRRELKKDY